MWSPHQQPGLARPPVEGHPMEWVSLDRQVFAAWCCIGSSLALSSDSQIAEFLIQSYHKAEAGTVCNHCGCPLSCASCCPPLPHPALVPSLPQRPLQRDQMIQTDKEEHISSDLNVNRATKEETKAQDVTEARRSVKSPSAVESPALPTLRESSKRILRQRIQQQNCKPRKPSLGTQKEKCTRWCKSKGDIVDNDRIRGFVSDPAKSLKRNSAKRLTEKTKEDTARNRGKVKAKHKQNGSVVSRENKAAHEKKDTLLSKAEKVNAKHVKKEQTEADEYGGDTDVEEGDISFSVPYDPKLVEDCKVGVEADSQGLGPYKCKFCTMTFLKKTDLNMHTDNHVGPKAHQCELCKRSFDQACALYTHKKFFHSALRPYECDECGKHFQQKGGLKMHKLIHLGRKDYVCDICDRAFRQAGQLKQHRMMHTGNKPFECEICKKKFPQASNLITHMVVHSGEKRHQCDLCGKSFTLLGALNKHTRRLHQGERPYKCDVCPKTFFTSNCLARHKIAHTGVKTHVCDECGKAYSCHSGLAAHKKLHTGVKNHMCEICSKAFYTRKQLNNHRMIHNGVRNHVCEVCSKAFLRPENLRRHMMKHTGKEHICDVCSKGFTTKYYLKQHKAMFHLHEKNFTCEICSETFAIAIQLKRHIKKVHERLDRKLRQDKRSRSQKPLQEEVVQAPVPPMLYQQREVVVPGVWTGYDGGEGWYHPRMAPTPIHPALPLDCATPLPPTPPIINYSMSAEQPR